MAQAIEMTEQKEARYGTPDYEAAALARAEVLQVQGEREMEAAFRIEETDPDRSFAIWAAEDTLLAARSERTAAGESRDLRSRVATAAARGIDACDC